MKKTWQKTLVGYVVGVLIAGGLFALVVARFGFSGEKTDTFKTLCDAFTVPSLLYLSLYALVRIAGEGSFDGLGYVLGRAAAFLLPFLNMKGENYADYKQRREEQRALVEKKAPSPLLVVGLVCLAFALLFLALYYFA